MPRQVERQRARPSARRAGAPAPRRSGSTPPREQQRPPPGDRHVHHRRPGAHGARAARLRRPLGRPPASSTCTCPRRPSAQVAEQAAKRWKLEPRSRCTSSPTTSAAASAPRCGMTVETVAAVELARAYGAPVRVVLDRAEELTDRRQPARHPSSSRTCSPTTAATSRRSPMDVHGDGGVSVGSVVALLGRFIYGKRPGRLRDYDVVTNQAARRAVPRAGRPADGLGRWSRPSTRSRTAAARTRSRCAGAGTATPSGARSTTGPPHCRSGSTAAARRLADRPLPPRASGWRARQLDLRRSTPAPRSSSASSRSGRRVVVARTTTQDMGTGIRCVIGEIVREELGLPADGCASRSAAPAPCTARPPAAAAPRRRSRPPPSTRPGGCATRWAATPGPEKLDPRRRPRSSASASATGAATSPRSRWAAWRSAAALSGAVHVTEVEVDTRLGTVRATRVWAGIAVGHIYAERLARSQCEGGDRSRASASRCTSSATSTR